MEGHTDVGEDTRSASLPYSLGKEIEVYIYRLSEQLASLRNCKMTAKFGGATGNFNAHHVAYPQHDWRAFGNRFVSEKLGLEREQWTTQISNYDHLGSIFDAIRRINTIMIDLDRDFWMYISMEYFKQKIKAGEVGSSAMPHKVNPIDFENSEGNLGVANAILQFLAQKLPVSVCSVTLQTQLSCAMLAFLLDIALLQYRAH